MQEVTQLLVESQIEDIEKALPEVKEKGIDIEELEAEFGKIKEELTTGDWGRIGVIAGVLWYKLDTLIKELSTSNSTLKNIERNTSKIK